jgi:hypothetical protein
MFGALIGASLGLSALGSIWSYGANKKAIAKEQNLALESANLTREQAVLERQQTQRQAALSWGQTMDLQSSQVGAYTASGVLATSGTPLALLQETRQTGLADYNAIITAGENKASYMESQADLIQMGANINAESAGNINTANLISGFGNVLGSAYNLYGNYKKTA